MSANVSYAMNAYRRASTAVPPVQAVVMVYDEIINCLLKLDFALQSRKFDEAFVHVERASTMTRGLRVSLDFGAGEEMAKQLDSFYGRFILALHRNYGTENAREGYRALRDSIVELRNAWAEIGNLPERKPQPIE